MVMGTESSHFINHHKGGTTVSSIPGTTEYEIPMYASMVYLLHLAYLILPRTQIQAFQIQMTLR